MYAGVPALFDEGLNKPVEEKEDEEMEDGASSDVQMRPYGFMAR